MTRDEVVALLQLAAAFDRRPIGKAEVASWFSAARDARWEFDMAADAIRHYYANVGKWVMPVDITLYIRDQRRYPAPVAQLAAAPADPADPDRVRAAVQWLSSKLAWPEPDSAMDRPCPRCHAQPRERCTRKVHHGPREGQRVPITGFHWSRQQAGGAA